MIRFARTFEFDELAELWALVRECAGRTNSEVWHIIHPNGDSESFAPGTARLIAFDWQRSDMTDATPSERPRFYLTTKIERVIPSENPFDYDSGNRVDLNQFDFGTVLP